MVLTLYLDRSSFLHRAHPLTKFLSMVAAFVAVFLLDDPLYVLPTTLFILAGLVLAGAVGNLWRLRWIFIPVFLFTSVVWALFYPGGGGSRDAVRFGLGMATKLDTFLATGVLFLSTTTVEELAYALTCLGVPYRVSFTLTLSFRLVPVFLDSALNVVEAQRCRGLDFNEGGLVARLRRYAPVMVPVFMGGLRRADNMAMALEVRGFGSGRRRTTAFWRSAGPTDLCLSALVAALVAIYFYLWWRGVGMIPG